MNLKNIKPLDKPLRLMRKKGELPKNTQWANITKEKQYFYDTTKRKSLWELKRNHELEYQEILKRIRKNFV